MELTPAGSKKYTYKTAKLTSPGNKTLYTALYKKSDIKKIEALEKKKRDMIVQISFFQHLLHTAFPCIRPLILYAIEVYSRMLEIIDHEINEIKNNPVESASKTIEVIDTGVFTIEAGNDLTFEARGTLTSIALPAPVVQNDFDPTPVITNDAPVNGFPLDSTKVTFTATDSRGVSVSDFINVIIKDTTAPIIKPISDLTVEATGSLTKVALPAPEVSDLVDSSPIITVNAPENFSLNSTQVTVAAKDFSNNTSSMTYTVNVIDTTPPELAGLEDKIIEAIGSLTVADLSGITALDGVDGVVPVTNDAPAGFSLGTTTVHFMAEDTHNNSVTGSIQVIVRDTISPETTHDYKAEGSWVNKPQTITFTSSDLGSGVKTTFYKINDGDTNSGNTVTLNTDGIIKLEYWSEDNAGNTEAVKSIIVQLDQTNPSIESTLNPAPNASGWNSSEVTVQFTAQDTLSGIESVTPSNTVTTEGAGQTVAGIAKDNAGNETSLTVSVNVDKTKPVIQITSPAGEITTTEDNYLIEGTASDVNLVNVKVNGTETPVNDGKFSLLIGLEKGENQITAEALDIAGWSSNTTVKIMREEVIVLPPEITVISPVSGAVLDEGLSSIHIQWSSPEGAINPETAQIKLNGEDITSKFEIKEQGAIYEFPQINSLLPGEYDLFVSIKNTSDIKAETQSHFTIRNSHILPPPPETPTSAYLTGRVVNSRTNQPIQGVKVNIHGNNTEAIYTDSNGYYSLPVNEIKEYKILIEEPGYSFAIKDVKVDSLSCDYTVDTSYLTPIDPAVAVITNEGGTYTHSQGLIEVEFPAGALNEGQTIEARSIWYEKAEELPGKLPITTAFTYCIELLPDGAVFNVPVKVRHKNTRGFKPGTPIPVGCFYKNLGRWLNESMAAVDATGEWVEFETSHFTPYDTNQPGLYLIADEYSYPQISKSNELFSMNGDYYGVPIRKSLKAENVSYASGEFHLQQIIPSEERMSLDYRSDTVNFGRIFQIEADNSKVNVSLNSPVKDILRFQGKEISKFYTPSKDKQITRIFSNLKRFRKGKDEDLETGIYKYSINYLTPVRGEYFETGMFGGLYQTLRPTGVFTEADPINQVMQGYIPIINGINSEFGSGWALSSAEKVVRGAMNALIINQGGQSVSFLPMPIKGVYNNFSYDIDGGGSIGIGIYDGNGFSIRNTSLTPFSDSSRVSAVVVDFNQDGKEDILAFNGEAPEIKLFLNIMDKRVNDYDPFFEEKELNISNLGLLNNCYLMSPFKSDLNKDGYEDILFTTYSEGGGYNLYLLQNNKGTDGLLRHLISGQYYVKAEGDFNGDKKRDYIVGNSSTKGARYFPIYGTDSLFVLGTETASGSEYIRDIYVKDINHDGCDDIIVNMKRIRGVGSGYGGSDEGEEPDTVNHHIVRRYLADLRGTLPLIGDTLYENYAMSGNCAVGDFTSEHDEDIAVLSCDQYHETTITLLKADPLGGYITSSSVQTVYNYDETLKQQVKALDFNNDDKLDIMWLNGGQFSSLMGDGKGGFQEGFNNYNYLWNIKTIGLSSFNHFGKTISRYKGQSGDDSLLTIDENAEFRYRRLMKDRSVHYYNDDGLLMVVEDAGGNRTKYSYIDANEDEKAEELEKIESPTEKITSFKYLSGKLSEIVDSSGRKTTFTYNLNGDLTFIFNPDGTQKKFEYDSKHLMTKFTDECGRETKYVYSDEGMLLKEIGPKRLETEMNEDGSVKEEQEKEKTILYTPEKSIGVPFKDNEGTKENPFPNQKEEDLKFKISVDGYPEEVSGKVNEFDSIISVTDELGKTTFFDRDSSDRITKITKPNMAEYDMGYDVYGNLISKKDMFVNAEYKYEYEDYWMQLKKVITPEFKTYEFEYLDEWIESQHRPLMTKLKDPLKQELSYEYGDFGVFKNLLKKKVDRRGNSIEYDYNSEGKVSKIWANVTRKDENGNEIPETVTIEFEYDQYNRLSKMIDPRGNEYGYDYDLMDRPVRTLYPGNSESLTEYDDSGRVTKTTDRDEKTTEYLYDLSGRLTGVKDALGNETTYHYDGKDRLAYTEDAEGHKTRYWFNEKNQLTKMWNEDDLLTFYQYDENGNIIKINKGGQELADTYTGGAEWDFTYDKSDRLIKLVFPKGSGSSETGGTGGIIVDDNRPNIGIQYDKEGNREKIARQATIMELNGENIVSGERETKFEYDILNRVQLVTFPDNTTIKYEYDKNNNVKSEKNRNGNWWNFTFDELNRITDVFNPLDECVSHIQYDRASNRIAETDALNRTNHFEYDVNDRVKKITDALGMSRTQEYSAAGDVLKIIDRNGIVSENFYDDLHRIMKIVENAEGLEEEKRVTEFGYNKVGNTEWIRDANGQETRMTYDAMNRLKTRTLPDSSEYGFAYTDYGYLSKVTTPMGEIHYGYDLRGNRTSKSLPGESCTYGYNIYDNMTYASNDNAVWSYNFDQMDRITNAVMNASGQNYVLDYGYQGARLNFIETPAGRSTYAYNDADRITQISTSDGQSFGYSYSAAGEVLGKTRPNGVNEANTFNELGRLVSIADTLNTKNLLTLNYQYDNEGNKLSEIKSFPGLTGESSVGKLYQYDNLYRLKGEKVIDPSAYAGVPTFDNAPTFTQLTNLDLDILGNRKTVTKQDGTGAVLSEEKYNTSGGMYNADPTSKINTVEDVILSDAKNLSHDLNGNITDDGKNTYVFDAENKLIQSTSKATGAVTTYAYDAEGRRVKKSSSFPGLTGESIFLYSGNQPVEEHSSVGSTWTIHGLGIDDVNRITKNGVNFYPLTNDQGSVYAVTDASGNVLQRYDYSPYGKVTVQDANGVILSDSEESIPLVNRLYQGRELDQETGLYFYRARYYSPELGRFISHDPMDYVDGMNMYEFVRGNPGRFTDPMGLETLVINDTAYDITKEKINSVYEGPKGYGEEHSKEQEKDNKKNTEQTANSGSNPPDKPNTGGSGEGVLSPEGERQVKAAAKENGVGLTPAGSGTGVGMMMTSQGPAATVSATPGIIAGTAAAPLLQEGDENQEDKEKKGGKNNGTGGNNQNDKANKPVNNALKDSSLTEQINKVVKSLDETGKPPEGVQQGKSPDGEVGQFKNKQGKLPVQGDKSYYTESDVYQNPKGQRGAKRIVVGKKGEVYYSDDHYKNFVQLR